ncbi:hypothetical protein [Neisseria sp. 74A18]|uniref:hypothetical protein n=1 Tax=Neisseria sp. 74A18 TaxID=1696094 RepID=UPI0006CAD706|nr:hypothetical protein [Neisseria sp. 74A18]KPN73478.1 hypothetical protein AKG43_07715 [Neisseria sp. 74A18]
MIRFAKNIFQTAWKFCTQIKNKLILYIKNRILKSIQTFFIKSYFRTKCFETTGMPPKFGFVTAVTHPQQTVKKPFTMAISHDKPKNNLSKINVKILNQILLMKHSKIFDYFYKTITPVNLCHTDGL